MLPSEITGPGPHANGGALRDGGTTAAEARAWVEATNAGTTHWTVGDRILGIGFTRAEPGTVTAVHSDEIVVEQPGVGSVRWSELDWWQLYRVH